MTTRDRADEIGGQFRTAADKNAIALANAAGRVARLEELAAAPPCLTFHRAHARERSQALARAKVEAARLLRQPELDPELRARAEAALLAINARPRVTFADRAYVERVRAARRESIPRPVRLPAMPRRAREHRVRARARARARAPTSADPDSEPPPRPRANLARRERASWRARGPGA
jgi:hypothetical protein